MSCQPAGIIEFIYRSNTEYRVPAILQVHIVITSLHLLHPLHSLHLYNCCTFRQTRLCICLTGPFQDGSMVRFENALVCGSDKASLDHQRTYIPHQVVIVRKKTKEI